MSPIRPLQRADLPEVAALYELVMRSGQLTPPPGLAPYFERTLLDHPWADPEIPSLVHTDAGGSIVAFQGSHVRRAGFDGRPIRIACAGQLVAHPDARHRAVGALLLRAYLGGVQDLTITDGATDQMREIWTRLGGQQVHLACIGWARVFRPVRFASELVAHVRHRPASSSTRRAPSATLDALSTRLGSPFSPPESSNLTAEPLTPYALVEHLPLIADRTRLHVAYDERYARWLFREVAAVSTRGQLVAHLVRDQSTRVLGWYVFYLNRGGSSDVLQVAAAGRDVGPVLDHLLHHAWSSGTAAVRGRLEPRLLEPLAHRRCLFRYAGDALVHSIDDAILGAIASGRSLLTRLDGEWWMGHHVLGFGA